MPPWPPDGIIMLGKAFLNSRREQIEKKNGENFMPNQHVDDSVLSDLLSIDVPVLNTEPQMLL